MESFHQNIKQKHFCNQQLVETFFFFFLQLKFNNL